MSTQVSGRNELRRSVEFETRRLADVSKDESEIEKMFLFQMLDGSGRDSDNRAETDYDPVYSIQEQRSLA